jgi:CHAD domain-containing protein
VQRAADYPPTTVGIRSGMAPKSGYLERETKLSATLGFDVPDLRGTAGRTERLPEEDLHSRYFDTPDLRLWSRGITLRHRTGDLSGPGTWTLKLPEHQHGATFERSELSWPGEASPVPGEALNILKGIIRRSTLGLIAELKTTRRRLKLQEPDGTAWGELDDDIVTVAGGPRDGVRFRQIEVEVEPDHPQVAKAVLTALRAAGAQSDAEPKLARALGVTARSRRAARPAPTSHRAPLGDVLRRSIGDGLDRILDHDYRMRLDAVLSPRDVHQSRVATRRLRSNLKTFRSVLDPVWLGHTRAELRWLGEALGRVRDCDVLASELDGGNGDPPDEAAGDAELRAILGAQRDAFSGELVTVLSRDRYLNLLDRLHAAAEMPPFLDHEKMAHGRAAGAGVPARRVLPDLVDLEWRALRRKLRKLGRGPTDHELHRARIRAKQLRYAAEAAAPIIGQRARRTAAAAEALQTVLGEHHDAVGAEAWLRRQAGGGSHRQAFRAGQLTVVEQQRQQRIRRQWPAAAEPLTKKRDRHWRR